MESSSHALGELFSQLGLPDDEPAIEAFIASHRPIPAGTRLLDAPFWSQSQVAFLREKCREDADWVALIDTLDARLRR